MLRCQDPSVLFYRYTTIWVQEFSSTVLLKYRCEPDLDLVRLRDKAGGATVGPVERRAPGSVVGPEQWRWEAVPQVIVPQAHTKVLVQESRGSVELFPPVAER